jgi:transcriptional regulator with XRE-family HTH domain
LLRERRGYLGVRDLADTIGVSAATLSRVERGKLPDIETFAKICRWLKVDPAEILEIKEFPERGRREMSEPATTIAVHFRADAVLDTQAAQDLAQLLLLAQRAFAGG